MSKLSRLSLIAPLLVAGIVAACGSTPSTAGVTPSSTPDPSGIVNTGGDIPDNVVWLTYSGAGFSIQYPEGWVRSGTSNGAAFSDKDSRITVAIRTGASAPTTQSVTSEISAMAGARITRAAHQVSLTAGPAVAVTYEIDGSIDPVTGKRPRLTVDRYEIGNGSRVAVLDLAAQIGVDNVDAYLAIARSFKWSA
jgi:hypothetical protein